MNSVFAFFSWDPFVFSEYQSFSAPIALGFLFSAGCKWSKGRPSPTIGNGELGEQLLWIEGLEPAKRPKFRFVAALGNIGKILPYGEPTDPNRLRGRDVLRLAACEYWPPRAAAVGREELKDDRGEVVIALVDIELTSGGGIPTALFDIFVSIERNGCWLGCRDGLFWCEVRCDEDFELFCDIVLAEIKLCLQAMGDICESLVLSLSCAPTSMSDSWADIRFPLVWAPLLTSLSMAWSTSPPHSFSVIDKTLVFRFGNTLFNISIDVLDRDFGLTLESTDFWSHLSILVSELLRSSSEERSSLSLATLMSSLTAPNSSESLLTSESPLFVVRFSSFGGIVSLFCHSLGGRKKTKINECYNWSPESSGHK